MFDSRASLPNEVRADIEQFLENARGTNSAWADARILPTFIRRNIKLAEAPSYGQTIFEYEQNCHGAEDYKKVAQFVHAQFQPPAQTELQQPVTAGEIQDDEPDFPEPPVPEIQPLESNINPDEPLATPDPQPEPEAPPQPPAEPAGDDQGQSRPPFQIRPIPQSEPHTPTEFTPSNREPNQHETGYGEY